MSTENFWNQITERVKSFYSNNRKIVTIAGIGIVAIAALVAFLSLYWMPKRESEAGAKLAKLHHYFTTDSFAVVVNGIKGKRMSTAPQIADDYPFTSKGKEAALMAGESYLQLGKFDKALKYLKKAKADDIFLGPSILAAQATCHAELGDIDKAGSLYEKAAKMGENEFTAKYYKSAGVHYEKAGNYKKALACYEAIKAKYGKSEVGTDIDKYIYKVKGLLGELNN